MHSKPVTVAVIADTHAKKLEELPGKVISALRRADMVIHLGDFTSKELLEKLRQLGNFCGIAGNHDNGIIHQGLKEMEVLEIGGKKVGLIHGLIWPFGSQKRMKSLFEKHQVDVILYGHTHLATSRFVDGTFMFNPGTLTGQFPASNCSFGLITLNHTISAKIFTIDGFKMPKVWFVKRVWAGVIAKTIRRVETWPYVDYRYFVTKLRPGLERMFLSLDRFFLRKKPA